MAIMASNNGKQHRNGNDPLIEMAEHIATQEFEALDSHAAVVARAVRREPSIA